MVETARPVKPQSVLNRIIFIVAVAFTLYHVLYITGTLSRLNIFFDIPVHLAGHLGVMLAFTFLLVSAGKDKLRKKVPWYDWVLMAIGLGWNLYIIFNFSDLYLRTNSGKPLTIPELITVWVFFLVVFEAARRTLGLSVAILGALFLFYPLVAQWMPGVFLGPPFTADRVGRGIGLFVTGMYGDILNISATIVISFIMFGQFLQLSGAGDWFINISNAILGRWRGGSAKVAVVANSLMGMVQGAAVAIVASVGVVAIPMMKKNGYKPEMAAAIEAVSANGGQIMPPVMGIAAFIMVDFLGVGYDKIVLAGILPAVVYYAALFFQVDFEAAKARLTGVSASQLPNFWKTLLGGWYYSIPIVVLLVFLLYLNYSAQLSAIYASAAAAVLTIVIVLAKHYGNSPGRRSPLVQQMKGTGMSFLIALKTTGTSMMMIAVMCAVAGIIVGSVQLTGLSFRLSMLLTAVAGNSLPLLLFLTAVVAIILGMGMPTSAVYILLATLVAPALVNMGLTPMAAHFFVFYFGVIALITPPVCPASYVSAAIADAPPMKTGWLGTRLGIAGFLVPFVFAFKPEMLLQGEILPGLLVGLEATIMVLALAAGLGGYLLRPLNSWMRIVVTIGGLVMLYPYGWWPQALGVALIVVPVAIQAVSMRTVPARTG